ncbi:MAG: hypothetical protein ACJ8LM_03895, partial [Candidatus Udaeobacter sp.]
LLVVPPYVLGAVFAVRAMFRYQTSNPVASDAARLGFYSTLAGAIAAAVIYDLVWQIFGYQIGLRLNSDLLLTCIRAVASDRTVTLFSSEFEKTLAKPFEVTTFVVQAIVSLILAVLIGSVSGFLSAKIMRRPASVSTLAH